MIPEVRLCKTSDRVKGYHPDESRCAPRGSEVAHRETMTKAHGERVQAAQASATISTSFGVAAIILLAAFAWLVLR